MDRPFWSRLEYAVCGWLAASGEPHLRWLWCDGFLPESIADTQFGVDVEGIAWVGNGKTQHPFRFVASLPQKLLQSDRENIAIDQLRLDEEQRTLTLTIRETRDPLPEHRP